MDLVLSSHFNLSELIRSEVALRHGLDNTPDDAVIVAMQRLCRDLLEPVRTLLAVPLHINSGYRSLAVNVRVGGARNSAHIEGRAADIIPIGMDLRSAFDTVRHSDLPFDQLIIECNAWLHIAIAPDGQPPRSMAMIASGGAGNWQYHQVSA